MFVLTSIAILLFQTICEAKDSNACELLDSNMGATFDVTDLIMYVE